jgi:hypothetical protein
MLVDAGNTKGESITVSLSLVWLVWNQLYGNWQFLFLFAEQTNPNQSNRRPMIQWSPFSIPWLMLSLCLRFLWNIVFDTIFLLKSHFAKLSFKRPFSDSVRFRRGVVSVDRRHCQTTEHCDSDCFKISRCQCCNTFFRHWCSRQMS